jgi:FG-GAP-like repeat/CARDB
MPDTLIDNSAATTQRIIQATAGIQIFSTASDSGISLDPTDTNDYFKLIVSRSSNVVVKLYPSGGDATISLLSNTGLPNNLVVGNTTNPGTLSDALMTDEPLSPGEYYIRVFADNPTTTISYTFTVETLPESRADLLWRNYSPGTGTNATWLMNGTAFTGVTPPAGPAIDPSWRLEGTGDFDGDGNADYLWHNTISGAIGFWLLDSTGNNTKAIVDGYASVPGDWYVGGFGDFNGNGTLDIYWRNGSTGDAGVWLMNGTTYAGVAGIDNIFDPAWVVEAVADFNGDNRPDLFYRNLATGANGIWLMNGTSLAEAVSLPTVAPSWRMEGVGDFNGDGKVDLVWRDYATGANGIWIMDRTTFVTAISLPNIDPGSGFQIASVLTSTPKPDLAGNTPDTGFFIGRLNDTANYVDRVNQGDPFDYYTFTIDSSTAKVSASIAGIGIAGNAELTIIPQDPANGSAIGSTILSADRKEIKDVVLNKGTYFVRVQSISPIAQDYSLTIGAKEDQPVNLFFTPGTTPSTQPIRLFQANGTTPIAGAVSVRNPFTLNVNYDFKYTGRTLNDFTVGFFISTDATIDLTDKRLSLVGGSNSLTVAGKLPDTLINLATNVVLPDKTDPFWNALGNGTYYIGVILDPDKLIDEKDATGIAKEDDNTIATQIQITGARNPDLTINPGNFTVTQTTPTKGSTVTLSGSVTNIGSAASDNSNQTGSRFNVGYYLSQDAVFSPNDRLLTTASFAPIVAGGSISFSSNIGEPATVPLPPAFFDTTSVVLPANWTGWRPATDPNKTYYIIAYIDPDASVAEEPDTLVNNFSPIAITVN